VGQIRATLLARKKIVKELSNLDPSGGASSASTLVVSTSTGAAVNSGQGSFTTGQVDSNYDDRQTALLKTYGTVT